MPKKVLVVEQIAQEGIDSLKGRGYQVDVRLDLEPEELKATIGDYDALIVRSATKVTPELLDAAKNLKIIGRAGVTVDNIDIEAANARGITVCNAPTSNIISAAEHTMALLLAAARNIPQANSTLHDGTWKRHCFMGRELYGHTLAIFGLGRVGGLVAERANAFGMRVIGYDPYCSPERAAQLDVVLFDSIKEMLPIADFISVHLPLTEETYGMFGPEEFSKMKDGVILVNSARGGIYNVDSLADFLAAGKIAACAIDVFEEEPCIDSPLHELEDAILTPHISAVTKEAQVRAGRQIAEYVWAGLEGSIVPTAINADTPVLDSLDSVKPFIRACKIMGRMVADLTGGMPKRVRVRLEGEISDSDPVLFITGVVQGILSYKKSGTVISDDVFSTAERHGMSVKSEVREDAGEYSSAISVIADEFEMAMTLYGVDSLARIISFMGYKIDVIPAKDSLIFEYVDAPGRIGIIGTILGEAGINITTMQIGTKPEENCALVFINVEGDVTDDVMNKLKSAFDYKNIWKLSI